MSHPITFTAYVTDEDERTITDFARWCISHGLQLQHDDNGKQKHRFTVRPANQLGGLIAMPAMLQLELTLREKAGKV